MKLRELLDRLDEIGGKYGNVYPANPPSIEEDEELDEEVLDEEEDEEEDK